MPEISRFYGIVISRMYYADHWPPHFHAEYGEHSALVDISTYALISGTLPSRALGLVIEWASLHQEELKVLWLKAENLEPLTKIAPLP